MNIKANVVSQKWKVLLKDTDGVYTEMIIDAESEEAARLKVADKVHEIIEIVGAVL